MQLARAEGGRLQSDTPYDVRAVMRVVVSDMTRSPQSSAITLNLPRTPVLSTIDPDALGIVCRNLVENALRHGTGNVEVQVAVTPGGELVVSNAGPVLAPELLAHLTDRFHRDTRKSDGSGLGLTIVAAIAKRTGSRLALASPRTGGQDGFEARFHLPATTLSPE